MAVLQRPSRPSPNHLMSHPHHPAKSPNPTSKEDLVLPPQASPEQPPSINSLLRSHCRTRLYVPPLAWTALHLDLLGCQLGQVKGPPTPSRENGGDRHPQCKQDDRRESAIRDAWYLPRANSLDCKRASIRGLLAYFDIIPVQ